jgi:benzoylformate decarboxylase
LDGVLEGEWDAVDDGVRDCVREAVLELLRGFGIRHIFGNPGSTELPLFLDFPSDFE